MPLMDFTAVLTSPNLTDTFNVLRRLETTNSFGENQPLAVQTISNITGVVYPDSKNELERTPEKSVQNKTIAVITKFALFGLSTDGATGQVYQPDIVVWKGNNFLVDKVEDWGNYGTGFVKASCTMMDVNALPNTVGVNLIIPAKLQQYPLTKVSSTVFTLPITPQTLLLFRNGGLITVENHDYTLVGSTITLTLPALVDDDFRAYV